MFTSCWRRRGACFVERDIPRPLLIWLVWLALRLPDDSPNELAHRFQLGAALSNPVTLAADDLPEHLESEPNDEAGQAQQVATPAVVNAAVDEVGELTEKELKRQIRITILHELAHHHGIDEEEIEEMGYG